MAAMRTRLLLLALAGCGRLQFDEASVDAPPPDAPPHDEDGDGFADTADNCPHVANPDQSNVDADGVGDVCDAGALQAEQIVLFEPFVDAATWQITGTAPVRYDQESVSADSRGGAEVHVIRDLSLATTDRIILGAHVGARDTNVRRQIYIALHESTNAFYYCELFENGAIQKYGLVYMDASMLFATVDAATPATTFENRDFRLAVTMPPTAATCSTDWPADRQQLAGATRDISPNQIEVYVQGVDIALNWLVVIR
jgi:hypothetical protein